MNIGYIMRWIIYHRKEASGEVVGLVHEIKLIEPFVQRMINP